jgi:hypothetical protein
MKKLLILILLVQCAILESQKIYLDENKVQVIDPSTAKYYKIVETEDDSTNKDGMLNKLVTIFALLRESVPG